MNLSLKWTQFALDAEVDSFGTKRICDEHNKLRFVAAQFIEAVEAHNQSPFDGPTLSAYNAAKARLLTHLDNSR